MQDVYAHVENPKFNLKQFYDDHKDSVDTLPFGEQDRVALVNNCKINFDSQSHKYEECVICLEPYKQGEILIELPVCGHIFHEDCIIGWLGKQSKCPTCKAPVRHNLYQLIKLGFGNKTPLVPYSPEPIQTQDALHSERDGDLTTENPLGSPNPSRATLLI